MLAHEALQSPEGSSAQLPLSEAGPAGQCAWYAQRHARPSPQVEVINMLADLAVQKLEGATDPVV